MIVIEEPSPVTPLVSSTEVLGKGAFGTVYGPFTANRMRDILTKFYQVTGGASTLPISPDPRCDTVMKQLLPDGSTYILKLCQEMKDMVTALKNGNRWHGSMKVWEKKIEAITKRF